MGSQVYLSTVKQLSSSSRPAGSCGIIPGAARREALCNGGGGRWMATNPRAWGQGRARDTRLIHSHQRAPRALLRLLSTSWERLSSAVSRGSAGNGRSAMPSLERLLRPAGAPQGAADPGQDRSAGRGATLALNYQERMCK